MKIKILSAVIVVGFASSLLSEVAFANAFDGGKNTLGTSYNITSIYADITTPNYPYVYDYSASSAWPMLTDSTGKYVQVGWYKAQRQGLVQDGVHYFSEVNYGNGEDYISSNQVGPQANTIHGYRVAVNNGFFDCTVDGANIASWPTKFTATGYQYYEELNGDQPYNAQFAGQASAHARFANLRIFANGTTYNSPFLTFATGYADAGITSTNYVVGQSSSSFDLWDTRY